MGGSYIADIVQLAWADQIAAFPSSLVQPGTRAVQTRSAAGPVPPAKTGTRTASAIRAAAGRRGPALQRHRRGCPKGPGAPATSTA